MHATRRAAEKDAIARWGELLRDTSTIPGRPIGLVPTAGLEPAQLALLPPQDSVSTNSTTSAVRGSLLLANTNHGFAVRPLLLARRCGGRFFFIEQRQTRGFLCRLRVFQRRQTRRCSRFGLERRGALEQSFRSA